MSAGRKVLNSAHAIMKRGSSFNVVAQSAVESRGEAVEVVQLALVEGHFVGCSIVLITPAKSTVAVWPGRSTRASAVTPGCAPVLSTS